MRSIQPDGDAFPNLSISLFINHSHSFHSDPGPSLSPFPSICQIWNHGTAYVA
jgi:hypothetical protein